MASPYEWPVGLKDGDAPWLPSLPIHLLPVTIEIGEPSWLTRLVCRCVGHMDCFCPECTEGGGRVCDRCGAEDVVTRASMAPERARWADHVNAYRDWAARRAAFARTHRHA